MSARELLGRFIPLRVERLSTEGARLFAASDPTPITLPRAELTKDVWEGDEIDAFVMADREGRLFATLKRPALTRGQVAFLRVSALTDFGAFVDWGLQKELLVPGAQQTHTLQVGDHIAVGLIVDERDRLCGTMRIASLLPEGGPVQKGDWVEGIAWRNDPGRGLFVIVEQAWVGLLPAEEPHRLRRGERADFRVAHILADGKVSLSLRAPAREAVDLDAQALLNDLRGPSPARLGDHSPPEAIRDRYQLSKKAYKRAAGRLIKEGKAEIDPSGVLVARGR